MALEARPRLGQRRRRAHHLAGAHGPLAPVLDRADVVCHFIFADRQKHVLERRARRLVAHAGGVELRQQGRHGRLDGDLVPPGRRGRRARLGQRVRGRVVHRIHLERVARAEAPRQEGHGALAPHRAGGHDRDAIA